MSHLIQLKCHIGLLLMIVPFRLAIKVLPLQLLVRSDLADSEGTSAVYILYTFPSLPLSSGGTA